MSNINNDLKEFSHFETLEGGWFHLWSVDECEDCGGECEAPNTMKLSFSGDPLEAFARNGVTERALNDCLGELGWSDDFGGAVCPDCYGKNEVAA
jgi:hypothetical protein